MQREGLGAGDGSEQYFETKHKMFTEKCTMGSRARAGSEARPESERRRLAAGRRTALSTGQNTALPAHSGPRPRPPRKNGCVLRVWPELTEPARRPATGRVTGQRPGGGVRRAASRRLQDRRWTGEQGHIREREGRLALIPLGGEGGKGQRGSSGARV